MVWERSLVITFSNRSAVVRPTLMTGGVDNTISERYAWSEADQLFSILGGQQAMIAAQTDKGHIGMLRAFIDALKELVGFVFAWGSNENYRLGAPTVYEDTVNSTTTRIAAMPVQVGDLEAKTLAVYKVLVYASQEAYDNKESAVRTYIFDAEDIALADGHGNVVLGLHFGGGGIGGGPLNVLGILHVHGPNSQGPAVHLQIEAGEIGLHQDGIGLIVAVVDDGDLTLSEVDSPDQAIQSIGKGNIPTLVPPAASAR